MQANQKPTDEPQTSAGRLPQALSFLIVIKRLINYARFMARPVNADAGATRSKILAAASSLFADRGLGQTSVRAIAKQAQVSLAMINHYFGSKDALYQACVESMYLELGGLRDSLQNSMHKESAPDQTFHAHQAQFIDGLVRAGWTFALKHRSALRLVMRDVIDEGEVPAERQQSFLLPFLDQAGSLFAHESARPLPLIRSSLQALVFMLVRFALCSDDEIMKVSQTDTPDRAQAAIENHLVQISQNLLLPFPENQDAHA